MKLKLVNPEDKMQKEVLERMEVVNARIVLRKPRMSRLKLMIAELQARLKRDEDAQFEDHAELAVLGKGRLLRAPRDLDDVG